MLVTGDLGQVDRANRIAAVPAAATISQLLCQRNCQPDL